jgi:hypothetical protein
MVGGFEIPKSQFAQVKANFRKALKFRRIYKERIAKS